MMSAHVSKKLKPEAVSHERPDVVRTIADAREWIGQAQREPGTVVGLVPTMGSLHEGHLSLIREARASCDVVVVSIFINPIQFGADEDLDSYPVDIEKDVELLAPEGVGIVFAPAAAEVYPKGFETRIDVGSVTEGLCGQSRPGHFDGVATVIAKLFNIIAPDKAYFGQKDAQQVVVIKRLVSDLNFSVEIVTCPIVRDDDGLALSSRNSYLSTEERSQAAVLYRSLTQARDAVAGGETRSAKLKRMIRKTIAAQFMVDFEYARIVDPETLEPVDEVDGPVLVAVAATVSNARLIDNMIIGSEGGE
jgi:pantoate--beta-alanine ligase